MSPRSKLALAVWQSAPDNSSWKQINAAWRLLHVLFEVADLLDSAEVS